MECGLVWGKGTVLHQGPDFLSRKGAFDAVVFDKTWTKKQLTFLDFEKKNVKNLNNRPRSFRDQTDRAKFDRTNKQSGSGYEVTCVTLRELRTELRNSTFAALISDVVNSFLEEQG